MLQNHARSHRVTHAFADDAVEDFHGCSCAILEQLEKFSERRLIVLTERSRINRRVRMKKFCAAKSCGAYDAGQIRRAAVGEVRTLFCETPERWHACAELVHIRNDAGFFVAGA